MTKRERPRVLQDIQTRRTVFRPASSFLNLSVVRVVRIPFSRSMKAFVCIAALFYLVIGSATAPTTTPYFSIANAQSGVEERAALEAQLRELESQIDEYENQIVGYQKQGKTLSNEISSLNSKISKITLQIKAINVTLSDLDVKIDDTEDKIQITIDTIEKNRSALVGLVKNLYRHDQATLLEIFLKNPKLSDFFSDVNNIALVQNNLRVTIAQIQDLKAGLEDQKEQYALAKADAETLRVFQASQRDETDRLKSQKNELLTITKGQETKYQAILKETKKTAAEIRSRIFKLLGGGELPFGEAVKIAQFAERATGVRAAMILAVLTQESAIDGVIGANLGRCYYNTPSSNKSGTVMSNAQKPSFLAIIKELNLNPDSTPVSCPIKSDGAYGGAMGPAQFMPTTWWDIEKGTGYKQRVSTVTGNSPASPFNNGDAFVATALYLKDAGADGTLSGDRQAAARYYAGGNWRRFLWSYGESVVSRAQSFQADIDTITAG